MPINYLEVKNSLKAFALEPQSDKAFHLLKMVSAFLGQVEGTSSASQGQELVIRLLDIAPHLTPYQPVLDGMVRQVGLFPYLDSDELSFADKLAFEFHRPQGTQDTVFHRAQADVYRRLMNGESVILSAPTSFGKSLIVDAIIASGKHKNIVIVVPTLALLDETRRRLSRFRDKYRIITHPSQKQGECNIFIQTQERVIQNETITTVDFFVIDEFYKLNPDADSERAETLNHAFYILARLAPQFYMLGPSIQSIPEGFRKRYNCSFISTDYATVVTETHLIGGDEREDKAANLCKKLLEPTLIYCASPARVRNFGKLLSSTTTQFSPSAEVRQAAEWIRENFHPEWSFANLLESGIGLHHGQLPRSIAQLVVRLFNKGLVNYLVCTSTLIEGVNTKAKNVVILDNKLANKKYNFFTFCNIRGRSGRMFEHFIGNVYLFHEPPQQELPFVDIPVFTQTETAPDSLLIQVESEDLSPSSKSRVELLFNQNILSMRTLKLNAGIPPDAQIALAEKILQTPDKFHTMLSWSGYPSNSQLYQCCDLLWDSFVKGRTATKVKSGKQLAFLLNKSLAFRSLEEWVEQDGGAGDVDSKIEDALGFIRQWPQYRAPKLFGALNRIQSEIFTRLGMHPGNYDYYMAVLESLGRSPVIMALDEYGIPFQLGERLWKALDSPDDLDMALERIRSVKVEELNLTEFEKRLIVELQPTL